MTRLSVREVLAGAAALCGILAAVAGSPFRVGHSATGVDQTVLNVAPQIAPVTAVELAGWIRDGKPGLRVIDVRPSSEFDEGHVPGAENFTRESLTSTAFRKDETLVLISDEQEPSATSRVSGGARLLFLRGGQQAWLDDLMNPVLPANSSPEVTAEFHRVATLSRYFGGTPRIGEAKDSQQPRRLSASVAAAVARRRGC